MQEMTKTRRRWAAALVAGAIVAACGGGGSGSVGPGTGAAASDLDSFLGQYCDLYASCCAQANKSYNQGKCRALFTSLLGAQATYNAAAGQQCLDGARADTTLPTFCKSGVSSATSATCKGVFQSTGGGGAKRPGEPCDTSNDCASSPDGDVTCLTTSSNGANVRLCQLRARVKEGSDCVGTKDADVTSYSLVGTTGTGGPPPTINICWVEDNLYCDSKTKKCVRIQDVGGPCESFDTHACSQAGYCDTATKRCVTRKAIGEACTSSTQCAEKAYCPSANKSCAASIPDGSPCTLNEECEGKSCTNRVCGSSFSVSISTALFCQ
jgi:hypothetical protein